MHFTSISLTSGSDTYSCNSPRINPSRFGSGVGVEIGAGCGVDVVHLYIPAPAAIAPTVSTMIAAIPSSCFMLADIVNEVVRLGLSHGEFQSTRFPREERPVTVRRSIIRGGVGWLM